MSTFEGDARQRLADGRVVVLVGTGVSWATAGTPLAGWKGFLQHAIECCETLCGASLPKGWASRQKQALEQGDLDELLNVAEGVSRKLSAPKGGEFRHLLRDTVGSLKAKDPALIDALAALKVPLLTCNYDNLLEEVTHRKAITWRQDDKSTRFLQDRSVSEILHIHGHWEDSESVILGVRSYEEIVGHEHLQSILRTMLMMNSVLFVGFGEGLADPNFEALRGWSSKVMAGTEHRHYRLCIASETEQLAHLHRGERIVPLPYGASHADLGPFLRRLSEASRPPKEPGSLVPVSAPTASGHAMERLASETREIQLLIASAQDPGEPLAVVAARALALAQQHSDEANVRFFRAELGGYGNEAPRTDHPDYPSHRAVRAFCSPNARVNPRYFGFGNSPNSIFDYLARDENYVQVSFVSPEPLSEIEMKAAQTTPPVGVLRWTQAFGSVFPEMVGTSNWDADDLVECVAPADSNKRLLQSIRNEVTRRLLSMSIIKSTAVLPNPAESANRPNDLRVAWKNIVGKTVELEPLYGDPNRDAPEPLFAVLKVNDIDVELQKLSSQQYIILPIDALSAPWGGTGSPLRAEVRTGALRFDVAKQRWRWGP